MGKIVRINMSVLTRMEYSLDVEVPEDATDSELQEFSNELYDLTEGSEFTEDPDFWEKGSVWCDADIEDLEDADKKFVRDEEGNLIEKNKD